MDNEREREGDDVTKRINPIVDFVEGVQQETSDLLVKWLLFLKAESKTKLEELAMSEPTIRKAVDVLEFLNQDKEARRLYELREKALKDELNMIEGAKAEGRTEGERQKAMEIAKNLLAMDMTVEMVAKATGLPTEEIEKLKEQLH
ncbi:Rpn family recombination-promoting nuclease/putative transposase [Brevibacillus sp. NRS-1366]|uniref:Rpn family recombination-promoting nuclease/putative transposase n=1 Tax=Brevibacillus sp. NRS-1366 TaxID=3233899 RepID=UPI003D259CD8